MNNDNENFKEAGKEDVEVKDFTSAGITDKQHGDLNLSEEQKAVKKYLAGQPTVQFFIPLAPGEVKGQAYRSVTLNTYRCEVKKGMMVDLPKPIFSILAEAMALESSVLTDHETNLNAASSDKKAALGI